MQDQQIPDRRNLAVPPAPPASGPARRGRFGSWPFLVRLVGRSTRHDRSADPDRVSRMGWLRAAVLGANDGLVSVASIVVGVAAGSGSQNHVLLSGIAGLVAGGMSMAAGEFVSVSSQADAEKAELAREAEDLRTRPDFELDQLAGIFVGRGVEPALAREVAAQMTRRDALGAHARDELGLSEALAARPLQAAFASALSFLTGGAVPLLAAWITDAGLMAASVIGATLLCLALLGAIGARLGGAKAGKAVWRVTFWGALAMAGTAGAGSLFGALVQ
jgi:VIT1/CCC1 family predicted Fe2+/Mn2+ transporter